MQELGSGPNYRLAVDAGKNRIYVWAFGDILNTSGVAALPNDAKAACNTMKPGFTVLVDFTGVKLLGLPDMIQQLQSIMLEAGVRRITSVWSEESFAKFIVDSSAHKVKGGAYEEKRQAFMNRGEAEAWLDK